MHEHPVVCRNSALVMVFMVCRWCDPRLDGSKCGTGHQSSKDPNSGELAELHVVEGLAEFGPALYDVNEILSVKYLVPYLG